MIRIDTIWLATEPMDMRAGTDTAMARVISVFGAAQPHCAYLFANRRATRMKVLVHGGLGIWLAARRLHQGKFAWPYTTYGRLEERYLFTSAGQKLTLVERSRRIEGVNYARLDDADRYRSLIDAAPVMLESGNIADYVGIWGRHHFSVFRKCSSCWDLFHLREGCIDCAGRGFVDDSDCPSKLPSWLSERAELPGASMTDYSVAVDGASPIMLLDTTIGSSTAHADEAAIREHAYALWEHNGSPEGSADDFWNEARQQLEAQKLSPIESDALSRGLNHL